METVALADFRGRKNVVLYFYPKDGTPGCTHAGDRVLRSRAGFREVRLGRARRVVRRLHHPRRVPRRERPLGHACSPIPTATSAARTAYGASRSEARRSCIVRVDVRHRQARQGPARAVRRHPEGPRGRECWAWSSRAQLMRADDADRPRHGGERSTSSSPTSGATRSRQTGADPVPPRRLRRDPARRSSARSRARRRASSVVRPARARGRVRRVRRAAPSRRAAGRVSGRARGRDAVRGRARRRARTA